MKRTVALFLALATALSLTLCACGGEDTPPTKEELLETAEEVTVYRLQKDFYDNIAAAKENYVGKPFIVRGRVTEIMEDSCVLYCRDSYSSFSYLIKANIPVDELKQLERKDVIRVVGTITDEIETTEETIYDSTYTKHYITLENAYLVEEITEISGTVHVTSGMYRTRYIEVPFLEGDSDKIELIPRDPDQLSEGDKVTIPVSELERDSIEKLYYAVVNSDSHIKIEPAAG